MALSKKSSIFRDHALKLNRRNQGVTAKRYDSSTNATSTRPTRQPVGACGSLLELATNGPRHEGCGTNSVRIEKRPSLQREIHFPSLTVQKHNRVPDH
jgi:hypothetical protein